MSYFAGLQEDYLHARAWWGERLATSGPTGEDSALLAVEEIDRARRRAVDWGLELMRRDQSDAVSVKAFIHEQVCEQFPRDESGAVSLEAVTPELCEGVERSEEEISEAVRGEFWSAVLENIALENGRPKQVAVTRELAERAIELGAMRADAPIVVMEQIDAWTEDGKVRPFPKLPSRVAR